MSRSHRLYEPLLQSVDLARLQSIARAQTLIAARFEPALRRNAPVGLLDLVFADGEAYGVVPLIVVAPAMLVEPQDDALVWPERVARLLKLETLDEIGASLYPWLYARSLLRELDDEQFEVFNDVRRAPLRRAREVGFLGAAPYARAFDRGAPAAYARRFAENARVGVAAASAASFARPLCVAAREVAVDLGEDSLNAFASCWYGCDAFRAIGADERFDVWVAPERAMRHAAVQIASDAVPDGFKEVCVSQAIPIARTRVVEPFGVRTNVAAPLREPRFGNPPDAAGGSSGRIALAGEDTGAASELSARLRAEGFTADLGVRAEAFATYAVVHVFGMRDVESTARLLLAARTAGKPAVLTPLLEDVAALGVWGESATSALFAATYDQREVGPYLSHLAAHTLN
ncbi:MAG: hypothetical protein ACREP1_03285, partial [Rhodanobacteraceae bacterium]